MKCRNYQKELVKLSSGSDNVLLQADTGSGKTRVLAKLAQDNKYVLCVAHRNILIKQLSRELASFNIQHSIIATTHTKRQCLLEHRKLGLGDSMVRVCSKYVCSIDSLLSRYYRGMLSINTSLPWTILVDEAHHMVDENKWGKLRQLFPNSRIIGATATPCRLDGVSLADGDGGVFHRLEQSPELEQDSMKKLIAKGFVSDFKCYSVPERINNSNLKLGKHDYTYKSLERETASVVFEMAGDAVKQYQRLACDKQALAFCVNIDIAIKTAEKFKQAGIPCAAIHSKMSNVDVARVFDLFERRCIKVLCNVDMIGEGVDVPEIEALIMMRKTASFGMYRQWVGRSLRPFAEKDHAILIDHVGNIRTHGLPDKHIDWSLTNPPQAEKSNLFTCPDCMALVKAWVSECPECGCDLRRAVDASRATDVHYIDYQLVELKRREIDHQTKNAAREKELAENLQLLSTKTSNMGALSKSVHKLKLWFSDVLLNHGASIYDLNTFLMTENDDRFWISRFTFSDINKNNDKCIKVYNKWLKSQ